MNKNSKFSLVLRQCRLNAGLTQKQMADALNIERSTYAYYETGATSPSSIKIIEIARILNIPYTTLMEAVGDTSFANADENSDNVILNDDSWLKREKMYTLPKEEQSLVVSFRTLTSEQKKELVKIIAKMKEINLEQQKRASNAAE